MPLRPWNRRSNQDCGPIGLQNHCPERGIRGIHAGLTRYQDRCLCFLPASGGLPVCLDAVFDELFTPPPPSGARLRTTGGSPVRNAASESRFQ